MAWYDPILLIFFIVGIILILFSHYHGKMWVYGFVLVFASAIIKIFLIFFA
ncbi:MAG: hypothetical protein KatS3mg001_011 [Candidatus Pacearchaeota archaeon]|nr:MAG: hypothetical protein KatS3mg001_011 [Candidatus Pacearchaeota archaeon]